MHWTQRPEVRAKISKTLKRKGCKPPIDIRATGENHHNWKGGIIYNNGYRLIKCDDPAHPYQYRGGYVYEHRRVIEKNIGRFLDPKEKVHHINGDITDNRLENLVLCQSNSEHFKVFHSNFINSLPKQKHKKGSGPTCPRCGCDDTSTSGKFWKCYDCKRYFSKNGKYKH